MPVVCTCANIGGRKSSLFAHVQAEIGIQEYFLDPQIKFPNKSKGTKLLCTFLLVGFGQK